ncbi:MAG: type II toxin-antitoxin system prevent-host-death family antitoxin [Spirochaetes bacterium]|jgi:prevent-host-death family protein|nr:type II toxin-antitoxin system prevent-host-death family antitoxin [Spirochaetota bacterium]
MNLESDIRSISYVKSNAADMLKQVNETHNPLVITQNGEAKGVLLDPKSYQEMINALGILKLTAAGERDIEAGRASDHETTMASLRESLQAKRANRKS